MNDLLAQYKRIKNEVNWNQWCAKKGVIKWHEEVVRGMGGEGRNFWWILWDHA